MAQVQAPPRGEAPSRSCTDLGMRRVSWVRVLVTDDGEAVCHVMGTGHRLPIFRRVPLATALALSAEGIRYVVRRESQRPRPASPPTAR